MSRLSSETASLEVRCHTCKKDVLLNMTREDYDSSDAQTHCYCPTCGDRLATARHIYNEVFIYGKGGHLAETVVVAEA